MRSHSPRYLLATTLLVALSPLIAPDRMAAAQGISTLGTDFWGCDMENTEGGVTEPFGILVANASTGPALVRIEGNTGLLASGSIPAGSLGTFTFDRSRMMVGTQQAPNAYHVLSDVPVAAYQFNPLSTLNVATNDASTLLPVPSLGTTYRPMARNQAGLFGLFDLPGSIALVGLSTSPTSVTLIPNGAIRAGFIPATPAGVPVNFVLNRFDVVHLLTDPAGGDLTGSLITSDRPIAVFGGARCAFVPDRVQACDHLEEQSFPVTAWGMDFLGVKTEPRGSEPDIWRIVAAENNTRVTLTPDPTGTSPITLDAGALVEFETPDDIHITADKPIQVGQFLVGQGYDPAVTVGDPSLILAVPTEQFDTDYLFLTPATYDLDYVTIVKPDSASVDLDGVPIPPASFVAIGTTGFSRARLSLTDGVHRVTATAGVGAYVYGYAAFASYGYYAGARTEDINTPITCDAGGPHQVSCLGGTITLDGSGSTGPGTLSFLWSALTPGVSIATPDAAITQATVGTGGPFTVGLSVTNGIDSAFCSVDVIVSGADALPPVVSCLPLVSAAPTQPAGSFVAVSASATDDCDPAPALVNDRTASGGNADDLYPCGETLVTFTATDLVGNVSACVTRVVVMNAGLPAGVSEDGAAAWLRVEKDKLDPTVLLLTFQDHGAPEELVNVYAGTIFPTGIVAYDHAPIACHAAPAILSPGVVLLRAPFDAGQSHYYLASASNCLGESTRGSRSDGVPRPSLPTDCGALP